MRTEEVRRLPKTEFAAYMASASKAASRKLAEFGVSPPTDPRKWEKMDEATEDAENLFWYLHGITNNVGEDGHVVVQALFQAPETFLVSGVTPGRWKPPYDGLYHAIRGAYVRD